jgi:hypothetical protein
MSLSSQRRKPSKTLYSEDTTHITRNWFHYYRQFHFIGVITVLTFSKSL